MAYRLKTLLGNTGSLSTQALMRAAMVAALAAAPGEVAYTTLAAHHSAEQVASETPSLMETDYSAFATTEPEAEGLCELEGPEYRFADVIFAGDDLVDASSLSFGTAVHDAAVDFLGVSGEDLDIDPAGGGASGARPGSRLGQGAAVNGLVNDGSGALNFTGAASGSGGGGGGGGGAATPEVAEVQGGVGIPGLPETDDPIGLLPGAGSGLPSGDIDPIAAEPLAPVPLPASVWLIGSALVALGVRRRVSAVSLAS